MRDEIAVHDKEVALKIIDLLVDQDYEDYYDEIASQKEKDTMILQGEGRYGIS